MQLRLDIVGAWLGVRRATEGCATCGGIPDETPQSPESWMRAAKLTVFFAIQGRDLGKNRGRTTLRLRD